MKKIIYISFLILNLLFANVEKQMVKITFNSYLELHELVEMGIDFDHHRTMTEVHAFVTNEEFELISQLNFGIQKIENQAKLYFEELKKNTFNSRNPMEDYHDYNELTTFLQNIATVYPNITKLESIGQSVQGRELWVMEISDNPGINEIEPEFKYVANMHGDETVGRELSLYLIEWLVQGYGNNDRATNIINNTDVFIMPSMNPDGFENGSRYNANGWHNENINIVNIIHDYVDIMNFSTNQRDWECGINVICESSEMYQNPINSVAFLDMGGFICSGAMVNNTRQDLTPYFLTAWHCIEGENPNTFRFYFNKEASVCENTWGSAGPYAYGSDIVADSNGIPGGDWALLLIDDEIEEDWEVFYAGWDVTENNPVISCGVHHPGGTPKKINYDNDTAYSAWWDNASEGLTHWQVNWDEGGSEGGSSGSPLFNDRFQIVGVLTGGSGGCGDVYPDLYGKLYYGWNWELESNRRLIDWLDPDYTGALVIDGTYVEITGILGDLNSDDSLNILDIIVLVNLILDDDIMNEDLQIADLNEDGMLNILDIIVLANIIISS